MSYKLSSILEHLQEQRSNDQIQNEGERKETIWAICAPDYQDNKSCLTNMKALCGHVS